MLKFTVIILLRMPKHHLLVKDIVHGIFYSSSFYPGFHASALLSDHPGLLLLKPFGLLLLFTKFNFSKL